MGKVERYTPMMVEVRLFHALANVGALKTLNQVVTIRQYNIQPRQGDQRQGDHMEGYTKKKVGVAEAEEAWFNLVLALTTLTSMLS